MIKKRMSHHGSSGGTPSHGGGGGGFHGGGGSPYTSSGGFHGGGGGVHGGSIGHFHGYRGYVPPSYPSNSVPYATWFEYGPEDAYLFAPTYSDCVASCYTLPAIERNACLTTCYVSPYSVVLPGSF